MDSDSSSWVCNLQHDLQIVPKYNLMMAKSNVYKLDLDAIGKENLKETLLKHLEFFWNICYYTQKQRNAFQFLCNHLHKDSETHTILAFYDIELNNLKTYYENNKQMFQLLDVYKEHVKRVNNSINLEKSILANILDTRARLKELDMKYTEATGKIFYVSGKTIDNYTRDILPNNVCDAEGYCNNGEKRVRTTFTEEQLQVLETNFQLDPNPDGQDLERIAQITGLSNRVTQVWFRNSRARQKKHMHTGKVKTQKKHMHTGKVKQQMHNERDDSNSSSRHISDINLHFTYSFQQQSNNKDSPIFTPTDECNAEGYDKNKEKRVRTTFTEEQLQILEENFQLDSNPDGQELEKIAKKTGLSNKVTKIWFQNSRARQKKQMYTRLVETQNSSLDELSQESTMHCKEEEL